MRDILTPAMWTGMKCDSLNKQIMFESYAVLLGHLKYKEVSFSL